MKKLIYLLFLSSIVTFGQEKVDLIINFTNIDAEKGKLCVALYSKNDHFLTEALKNEIVEISNGKATIIFRALNGGEYAVSSFFDKNENGILDTNALGIPIEAYQFSNNAKGFLGPPKFKQAKLEVKKDTVIHIRY